MQGLDDPVGDGDLLQKLMDVVLAAVDRLLDRARLEEVAVHRHGKQEHAVDEGGASALPS